MEIGNFSNYEENSKGVNLSLLSHILSNMFHHNEKKKYLPKVINRVRIISYRLAYLLV